jgi:hypothetical protein
MKGDGSAGPPLRRWQVACVIEGVALMIGLVMPVTPSKTGSDWSMAQLVFPEPSYLQEVLVYFVLTNLLIVAFVGTLWLFVRLEQRRPKASGD